MEHVLEAEDEVDNCQGELPLPNPNMPDEEAQLPGEEV
jgi:hypothetical protein